MNGITALVTAVIAFALTAVLGIWMIPFLRKIKYGQTINDVGPTWHKSKQGTPVMGGIMFIVGITVAAFVGFAMMAVKYDGMFAENYLIENVKFFAGIVMALAFGFLGFTDDYIKVVKKRNLGLTALQKIIVQLIIAIAYLVTVYLAGDTSTIIAIPFIGQLDLGIIYYPFCVFLIIGFVNAVNLTDGIDGLAASVTFVTALGFMVMSTMLSYMGMTILAIALAGGCVGFLIWNFHPAKVFMGDTGSMFLGGMVVALAFGIGLPLMLLLAGFIYLAEALSVMIQVTSFKLTGKRVFKMSPIHHHFEMSGFSEVKIVALFSFIAAIGCILAGIAVYIM